jgi:hypothetical protein
MPPETMDPKLQDPEKEQHSTPEPDLANADGSSIGGGSDVLDLQDLDPVLNMKMHLVNNVSNFPSKEWKNFPRHGPVHFSVGVPVEPPRNSDIWLL